MKPTIPLIILFLLCIIIISTQSKTIYVSNTHEGTGNGTISNPFRNLTQAFDHYNHEDIYDILIQPGVYNETIQTESMNIVFKEGLNLSVSKMDFEGVPGEVVVDFLSVVAEGVSVNVKEIVFSEGFNAGSVSVLKVDSCESEVWFFSKCGSVEFVNVSGFVNGGGDGLVEMSGCRFSGSSSSIQGHTGKFMNNVFMDEAIQFDFSVLILDGFLFENIVSNVYPVQVNRYTQVSLKNGEFKNCSQSVKNFDITQGSAIGFLTLEEKRSIDMENVKFICNSVFDTQTNVSVFLPPVWIGYTEDLTTLTNVETVDCTTTCITGYASKEHVFACKRCDFGSYAPSNTTTECMLCPAGSFSSSGSASCDICPPGKYASGEGNSFCISCSTNTFAPQNGTDNCTACDFGEVNKNMTQCTPCAPGTYFFIDQCTPCDFFFLTSKEGSGSCTEISIAGYISIAVISAVVVVFIIILICLCMKSDKTNYSEIH